MRPFKDQPISRKTLALGVLPALFALVVGILASVISTFLVSRSVQFADVAAQATIVATNGAAGLAAGDRELVDDLVQTFQVRTNIDMLCVYDVSGRVFSSFQRRGRICPAILPPSVPTVLPTAVKSVIAGDAVVGTVYITGNYSNLFSWIRTQALTAVSAVLCGLLLAVGLTWYLRRYLTTPILDLAGALDRVSTSSDYSTRVTRKTGDEVGKLVDSFNTMLGVIEKKDSERNDLLQKSLESNRVKDEFLATVSHELRTPLNAMLGWLQIIRTSKLEPEVLDRAMASIERNAKSQARLVEDLIELSRVVTGKLRLTTKPMDLRSAVETSVEVVRTAASAKGVSLKASLPDAPVLVSGDPDRLQQVTWNLLSNAVKFTEPGGSISVDLQSDDNHVSVVIVDTGVGISKEFLPFVFDRFRQADQSTTREHGGLGLGLAIAKEITELHGGTLRASSDGRGHGSRFTLILPRLTGVDPAAVVPRNVEQPDLAGRRILVVDDDSENLEIAATALAVTGATIVRAASGREALQQWESQPFNVIICDLAMPEMDGFEVLRRIRRADAGRALDTAIALTALASDADRSAVLAAGFDDHIVKPFDFPDLIRAVSRPAASTSTVRPAPARIGMHRTNP